MKEDRDRERESEVRNGVLSGVLISEDSQRVSVGDNEPIKNGRN